MLQPFTLILLPVLQTHRVDGDQQAVVCPCSQLHAAVLHVEWEVQDDDLAVTLENGWRVPVDQPGVVQQDFSLVDDGEVAVSTAGDSKKKSKRRPVSDSSEEALKDTTAVWRLSGEDYLLYSTRSGFHMSVDGTLIFLIPP